MRIFSIIFTVFVLLCPFLTSAVHAEDAPPNNSLTMNYVSKIEMPDSAVSYILSPDKKHIAFICKKDTLYFARWDGKTGRVYDHIFFGTLTFSPDNNHLAYIADKNGEWFVVIDNREGLHHTGKVLFDQSPLKFITSDTVMYTVIDNKVLYLINENIQ